MIIKAIATAVQNIFAGEAEPAPDNEGLVTDPPEPSPRPAWAEQLPDDLKSNEAFTGYKTLGELGQAHLDLKGTTTELEGKVANSIPKLGETPTEDETNTFYDALGRPKAPGEYEVNRPDWPEALGAYPEAMENEFRDAAHKLGMTQSQMQGAYDFYFNNILKAGEAIGDFFSTSDEAVQKRQEATTKELAELWGENAAANTEVATRSMWYFADQETMDFIDDSGLGDDTKIIKLFHRIGSELIGDKMIRDVLPPGPAEKDRKTQDGTVLIDYPSMKDL
tara:strand:+ start:326 stop:1162 length:837 start_codon:yes stop_codon:yes gene_type:complete